MSDVTSARMLFDWHSFPNVDDELFAETFGRNFVDAATMEWDGAKGAAIELCIDPQTGECLARIVKRRDDPLAWWLAR
jgi:hypothetical protein